MKNAVVTGASKGIGRGICEALLKNNYQVYGISRTKPLMNFGENFHWIQFDLSKTELIPSLVGTLPENIDLLVNDAGVWEILPLAKLTLEHFSKTMHINFMAPVFLTTSLLTRMTTNSVVINISSEMGIITEEGYGIYSASKAALDRFTTTLAKEQPNLLVLGVLPASVDTEGAREAYHYESDPTRITVDEITQVVMNAIDGKFETGSLLLVYNNECLPYWETRDKFTLVNVDETL